MKIVAFMGSPRTKGLCSQFTESVLKCAASKGAETKQFNLVNIREPLIIINLSLPRRRESRDVKGFWIPVFTGRTFLEVPII